MGQPENELKYELPEQSYLKLLRILREDAPPLRFRNAYFVTSDDSGRSDWVLRLRSDGYVGVGRGELTLKIGREISPGNFSSTEYTATVESDRPQDWEQTEPMAVFRREISEAPVRPQGEARNERRLLVAPLGPLARWELDRTVLPDGTVFHELEMEFPPEVVPAPLQLAGFRTELEGWFSTNGMAAAASRKTKYRRFLESLGGLG